MGNKTVTFSNKINATVLRDLKLRIKGVYSPADVNIATPAAGTKITFSDLKGIYDAARQSIFAIKRSFGTRTLANFSGVTISGAHGIGIVEKTVGDLEQLCNSNQTGNAGNRSFTAATNSANFSGNATSNSTNRSSGYEFNYTAFHTSQGSTRAAVHNSNCRTNFSGNMGAVFGGNRSSYTAEICSTNFISNFSGNSANTCTVVHSTFRVQGVDF